ncbi:MAG TPA: hypothetical protein VH724_14480 [Candidatus Angelobacter sp.]|nr:hypothetical protein [Candidatus Angelobacter sp.]
MFNNLVEDWCNAGLRFSFDDLVIQRGWGLPTVHLEADFVARCRMGEVLTAKLFVRKIGRSPFMPISCCAGLTRRTAFAEKWCLY